MKQLSPATLVNLAIAAGASSPTPSGGAGSAAWSTTLNAPVFWDGSAWNPATGGGWTEIGAINTTSGSSVSFTAIPATYSDLMLLFEGVSHNNGSSTTLSLELSANNGANWTTGTTTLSSVTLTAADTAYGHSTIFGYRNSEGAVVTTLAGLAADRTMAGPNPQGRPYRLAGGVNAIRIGLAAGAFDAGVIKLMARL